ncbi:class I SAM-dependent methyltransferase [Aspergillus undulatus]|uniref:class I SAM-dependent methyltransferase n=1 Tax=Aspergillus undulatus TaxID=1810928 RepID=UPI003CCD16F2
MLEYACGPGHISLALAPFVSRVIGIDIADGMIEEFNKNVHEAGCSDTVFGIRANLLSESTSAEVAGSEYFDFDLVVVSMALHHFEHPEQAVKRLGERLKKGGVMMLMDLVPEEHHGHDGHHDRHDHGLGSLSQMSEIAGTISKHGFSLEEMKTMYEDAGVASEFKYQILEKPLEFRKDGKVFHKTIFMARAQK